MTIYEDEQSIWVIKDVQSRFAHANSIREIDKNTVAYIRYCTFGEECRGYITKEKALKALDCLNSAKDKYGFDVEFHLEQANMTELVRQHREFTGVNMILTEKNIDQSCLIMRNKRVKTIVSVI